MTGWGGRKAQGIRAQLAALLPQPCSVCGGDVTPDTPWDVDHVVPRAQGGAVYDVRNCHPAHASCNRSRGGKASGRRRSGGPEPNPVMV